jgi:Cu/Zn superoxide dismutase
MTLKPLLRTFILLGVSAVLAFPLLAQDGGSPETTATLLNVEGNPVGQVIFTALDEGKTQITVEVEGVEPGFHGFHIHAPALAMRPPSARLPPPGVIWRMAMKRSPIPTIMETCLPCW